MLLKKKIFIKGFIKAETGLRVGAGRETMEIGGIDLSVVKLPNGLPYIPGSSIKGKIRCLLERTSFDLEPVKEYWDKENLRKSKEKELEKIEKDNQQKKDIEFQLKKVKEELEKIEKELKQAEEKLKGKGWIKRQNIIIHTCEDPNCPICLVFGRPAETGTNQPTRLFVRDAHLVVEDEEIEKFEQTVGKSEKTELKSFQKLYPDLAKMHLYTEIKSENTIDRLTSAANPRKIERVPAGVLFHFELVYNVFEDKDEQMFEGVVLKGMRLLEDDYLGGMGSRGYGKIKFVNLFKAELTLEDYEKGNKPYFESFSLENSHADHQ